MPASLSGVRAAENSLLIARDLAPSPCRRVSADVSPACQRVDDVLRSTRFARCRNAVQRASAKRYVVVRVRGNAFTIGQH